MIPAGVSFSVGDVLAKTFSTFVRNLPALLLIAIVVEAPLAIYGLIGPVPDDLDALTVHEWVTAGVGLLLYSVMIASVTYLVVEDVGGRRASIGKSLGVGFSLMLPTLAVTILWFLLLTIGMFALLVPGMIVWCIMFVVVPASVVERPGVFAAFGRSAELTKGHRWQIFALSLVYGLILIAFYLVLGIVLGDRWLDESTEISRGDWTIRVLLDLVFRIVVSAFGAVLSATAYVALRADKDGVGATDLAKVFE